MKRYSLALALALMVPASSVHAHRMPPYPPGWVELDLEKRTQIDRFLQSIGAHQSSSGGRPCPASGVVKIPVILIDFEDNPARAHAYPPSYFEALLFGTAEGAKSLTNYYLENAYGTLEVQGSVTPWIRSSYPYNGHYVNRDGVVPSDDDNGFDTSSGAATGTDHPRNVWGLVKEAVELADPYLDFRDFDSDGDGYIDAVIVVHAGCGAELQSCLPTADHIWSHQSRLGDYFQQAAEHLWPVVVDGVTADVYTLNPEDGALGVFCHEFGHTLGLPDLYSTDTLKSRVGRFCLMDYGGWSGVPFGSCPSHLSAWCKSLLGWLVPTGIDSETDPMLEPWPVTLSAVEETSVAYRVLDNPAGVDWSQPGPGSGEYFLVENRQLRGFDAQLFQGVGASGDGLLLLHVDESQPNNNQLERLLVSVLQADGGGLGQIDWGTPADLWVPGRELTPWSTPSSQLYDGTFTGVSVTQIQQLGAGRIGAVLSRGETHPGEDMYVFPNPWVIEENEGPVVISLAAASAAEVGQRARRLRVWIYDLSGSLVRVLDDDIEAPSNADRAYWDGRNENGERVAAGVFFLYVDNGLRQTTGKIAVVR